MTTNELKAGMMTATDNYANGGSTIRFFAAYYTRFALGFITTAVTR